MKWWLWQKLALLESLTRTVVLNVFSLERTLKRTLSGQNRTSYIVPTLICSALYPDETRVELFCTLPNCCILPLSLAKMIGTVIKFLGIISVAALAVNAQATTTATSPAPSSTSALTPCIANCLQIASSSGCPDVYVAARILSRWKF